MTVVYVDLLFFLNLMANYLLLLGAGRMAGAVLRRWRIALGACGGALYAVAAFLQGCEWTAQWPCKIAAGILLPLIAYGGEKGLLRITVLFLGASAGLAGVVLAVEALGSGGLMLENGVLYSDFDLRLLLLLFSICYFVMSLFFRRIGGHDRRELIRLTVQLEDIRVELTALVDSGHTLTDPATNKTVIVAEAALFRKFLPLSIDPARPIEGLQRCREYGVNGACLIPYRSVGVDCGILLAFRAHSVQAGKRTLGRLLVALSPNPVSDGGDYQALIGGF